MTDPALTTTLTLLFKDKTEAEISSALTQTLGLKLAEKLAWTLAYDAGITISVALSPGDILNELEERGDWADNTYEFVGTREDLVFTCQMYEWGDLGEAQGTARDELFDKLVEDGLIKATPVTSEVTDA